MPLRPANNSTFTDGDGVERTIWVIEAGAEDPPEAGPEDIIYEAES